MPYVKIRGKSCYYEEHGEGIPILFLHGNTASSNMFIGIKDLFVEDYKVIVLDFLGHGRSDRLDKFCEDFWYDEALQAIEFIEQMKYGKVYLIGSSGGALVAINIALERPDLVGKVIADSFEGEFALKEFTQNIIDDRAASKQDVGARSFYWAMHGDDWENVVDNDTYAIHEHAKRIGKFFHKPLQTLNVQILLIGSEEDEFICFIDPRFFSRVYTEMIERIGHGSIHIFKQGGHPAIMSNSKEFKTVAEDFFRELSRDIDG